MADELSEDEQIRLLFKEAGRDVVTNAQQSFANLTTSMKDAARAADQVKDATKNYDDSVNRALKKTLKDLVGDEQGTGGFAGMAGATLKAERALNSMVSGHGLARAAPMLEGLVTAMGGPGGLGVAVIALEMGMRVLVPTLEKLGSAISDEHIVKLNNFTTSLAKLREEGEKVSAPSGHPEMDKRVKEYLEQGAGATLSTLLQAELYKRLAQANTLTDAQKLAGMALKPEADLQANAKRQADLLMGLIEHREAGAIGQAQQLLANNVTGANPRGDGESDSTGQDGGRSKAGQREFRRPAGPVTRTNSAGDRARGTRSKATGGSRQEGKRPDTPAPRHGSSRRRGHQRPDRRPVERGRADRESRAAPDDQSTRASEPTARL